MDPRIFVLTLDYNSNTTLISLLTCCTFDLLGAFSIGLYASLTSPHRLCMCMCVCETTFFLKALKNALCLSCLFPALINVITENVASLIINVNLRFIHIFACFASSFLFYYWVAFHFMTHPQGLNCSFVLSTNISEVVTLSSASS